MSLFFNIAKKKKKKKKKKKGNMYFYYLYCIFKKVYKDQRFALVLVNQIKKILNIKSNKKYKILIY